MKKSLFEKSTYKIHKHPTTLLPSSFTILLSESLMIRQSHCNIDRANDIADLQAWIFDCISSKLEVSSTACTAPSLLDMILKYFIKPSATAFLTLPSGALNTYQYIS